MSTSLHISSLVVTADPARLEAVIEQIAKLEIAEVAIAAPSGKLVVTLETASEQRLVQGLTDIQLMPGVASAALCYHHAEDIAAPAPREHEERP